jgi:signal transduction histidine kinase
VAYLKQKIKTDDEKLKFTLESIVESTQRADDIIKDLLDFASLSRINKTLLDLNQLLDKALMLIHYPMKKNRIKLKKEYSSSLPKVDVDPNRIQQVLVNLILNAVQSMPKGGDLIIRTYTLRPQAEGKGKQKGLIDRTQMVAVEIEDTGEGIPTDKLDKIFDPFFTTKRISGGIGLGLSVAHNIVDMHNGKLFVENRSKRGVRATLLLKLGRTK